MMSLQSFRLCASALTAMLLFLTTSTAEAQKMSSIASRWADSFVEWDIQSYLTPADEEASEETTLGSLKLRWLRSEIFSEWDYDWNGGNGTIRQKWKNDPTQWELRDDENIVTMRPLWPNDPSQWKITDNTRTFTLSMRYNGITDEWLVQDPTYGRLYIYTIHEGDPRDWAIEDDLKPEISHAMRMAAVFLAIFISSPKE